MEYYHVYFFYEKYKNNLLNEVVSLTKQSFKDECDINNILSRYDLSGSLPNPNPKQPQYGDFTNVNFQNSANLIAECKSTCKNLPLVSREKYDSFDDYIFDILDVEDSKKEEKSEENPAFDNDIGSKNQLSI